MTAISPKPFEAIATVALKSPQVFPQANKDNPNKAYGKFKISPIIWSRSITISDKKLIHIIDITKAIIENKNISFYGATDFFVLHNKSNEQTIPGKRSAAHISKINSVCDSKSPAKKQNAIGVVKGKIAALFRFHSDSSHIGIEKSRIITKGISKMR